jgi:hypothetical protein
MFLPRSVVMRRCVVLMNMLVFVACCQAQSHYPEKLAEGAFETTPTQKASDPSQQWILWREVNGESHVEDHFSSFEDPLQMLSSNVGHLSSELKAELGDKHGETQLDVTFSSDWKIKRLLLRGVRVADNSPLEIASCKVGDTEISCKGLAHGAKFKKTRSQELMLAFPFPLLLRNLALRAKRDLNHNIEVDLVELRIDNGKLELLPCAATVSLVGEEVLSFGERRFNARKYSIERVTSSGTIRTLLWLSGDDVVLASENQDRSFADSRVWMSRFKQYSPF